METTDTSKTPDTTEAANPGTPEPVAATPPAPPVAGDPPQDPDIIGSLTPAEMGALTSIRQRSAQITNEIGQGVIRQARMLAMCSEMEEQAQGVIQGVGKRLNVPEGQQFQILPDGRLRSLKFPPNAPPAA
jgi:hypothetical protein